MAAQAPSDFPIPARLVGAERVEVTLTVDRTFVPPGDGRELGLAFGSFSVR